MKIKKLLSCVLSVILILTIIPIFDVSVLADRYYQEGDYIYSIDFWGNPDVLGEAISGYIGTDTHLIIPEELNITDIRYYEGTEFELNYNVNEITLPKTLKWLDSRAFAFFPNLEKINVPNIDVNIRPSVFSENKKLISINLLEDNDRYCSVDGVLFNKDITELICYPMGKNNEDYIVPNTVTNIAGEAFRFSTLKSISLSESLRIIGKHAFKDSGLESIDIPKSVIKIDYGAFWNCKNLTNITMPCKIKTIYGQSFLGCIALKNINIPETVTVIGTSAFSGSGLENFVVPNSVTKIKEGAFNRCTSLKTFYFPDSMKSPGGGSILYGCVNLKKVILPSDLKCIGGSMFKNCTALTNISIPESVTTINYRAFENSGLTSITIPKNVKTVYTKAFYNCDNLTSVKFAGEVKEIGKSAFSKCVNLKTVNFTKGYLKKVYDYAFYKCEKLDKITISNTKNVPSIHKSAFNKAKSGIKFYVKNNTVAKKLKAKLQKTNIKKAKIYRSAPILLYKNVG